MTEASASTSTPKGDAPNRRVSPLLLLLIVLGAGAAALAVCRLHARALERPYLLPERTRQLIGTASMEPVGVSLFATALTGTTEHSNPPEVSADLRIAFRVPAAYIARATDEKRSLGRGWFALRLWSETFDPIRPDELADLATCSGEEMFRSCPRRGPEGSRYAARRGAGEYAIEMEVGHTAGTEAHRRYAMAHEAGIGRGRGSSLQPCDTHWDEALGMLVSRTPEGMRPMGVCNFGVTPSIYKNGRVLMPAAFLKLQADGTPRFSVKCGSYVSAEDEGVPPKRCRLLGFHGPWPMLVTVQSDRAAEWEGTFDRLRDFLERHTVLRTD